MGSASRLKFLVCSDAHIDATTAGLPRFGDVKSAVYETITAARDQDCGLWCFAGDWSDPDTKRAWAAAEVAVDVFSVLRYYERSQLWITGNHDVVEDGQGSSVLGPLRSAATHAKDFAVVSHVPMVAIFSGVAFLTLPYTPIALNYDPSEAVRRLAKDCKGAREVVVLGHLNAEGIAPGSETTDMPRGRDVFWPLDEIRKQLPGALLIGGHYHRRQVYEGLQIVGSLERLTLGEEHNSPGYLICEV